MTMAPLRSLTPGLALLLFARLAPAASFDSGGVPIAYTIEGKGSPVILIHGLYSSADINWRLPGTIRTLAANRQVIAFDARGHGRSGKPESQQAYGIELAEDVVRLMDHLGLRTAHIAGYSMGGMIAMKLVTRHPDRVRSVALGGMGWLRQGGFIQAWFNSLSPKPGSGATPSPCMRSLGDLAISEKELRGISVPVAILAGDRDPVRELYVAPLLRVRSDWPVTVIADAGHFDCVVKPQFQKALKDWLDRQSR